MCLQDTLQLIINLEWWHPFSVFKSTQERNYLYFIAKVWKSSMTCQKPLTWPCRPGLTSALVIRPAFFLLQDCHRAQFTAANGGDGIPVELFQILKDDAVKVRHSICQQIWKTQQWPQHWKRSVFIPVAKKGHAKECSDYRTIALISHASHLQGRTESDTTEAT